MSGTISGIHHITAIASDPQRNVDFYTGVLGLRLVKRTVNFDDPATYHLYYGDRTGQPGTILTFFPWTGIPRGAGGVGQVGTTAFAMPPESAAYWLERLRSHDVATTGPESRGAETVLAFHDPDGLALELVAAPGSDALPGWDGGGVPEHHAVRGFHGATFHLARLEPTAALLRDVFGFREEPVDENHIRLIAAGDAPGRTIDLRVAASNARGRLGAGSVHHIAWRAKDLAEQREWAQVLIARGLHATPVQDRQYFQSIYFREPGGILFEIATDPPGFTRDETTAELGSRLMLPPWLEPVRGRIETGLVPLRLPGAEVA